MRKRKTTIYQDFRQQNLMKELKNLAKDKRASIDTENIKTKIRNKNLGQNLLEFDPKDFDDDLVNFYLGDPEKAKKSAPGYMEPVVSSIRTNGKNKLIII